jgi:acyl-CoA reductase-like NAD-dependent aldehyde dehydrogenase
MSVVARCPADGWIVGQVPEMSAADVTIAAAQLRNAQPAWEALGFAGRRRWLQRFGDWLLDNEDRLHRLVRDEAGKAWRDLASSEVPTAVEVLNYYADHGEEFLAPRTPRPHSVAMATKKLAVEYRPYPLAGVITPWNAQIANAMLDIPAALMAGCAVLSKPSVERVYVEAPVYDEFLAKVRAGVSQLRYGMDEPGGYATDYGVMLTTGQLEIVERHVADAREKGATVETGGQRAGQCFEPTVLTGVDHAMACMREETFGPTLPIMKVASVDEAVDLANDSPYGLSGSVWTRNEQKGRAIARRMNTGSVNVNNVLTNVFQLPVPMAGWGDSGLGSRSGPEGILRFTRTQSVISERVAPTNEPYGYPRSPARAKVVARLTRALGARDWRPRLGRTRTKGRT